MEKYNLFLPELSKKQKKAISWRLCGVRGYSRIADRMNVSPSTVQSYFRAIKKKLAISDMPELDAYFEDLLLTCNFSLEDRFLRKRRRFFLTKEYKKIFGKLNQNAHFKEQGF